MKHDDEGEWVPMTPERLAAFTRQFVTEGIPVIHLPTKIVEDVRLPDGPQRIQPFKKIERRRRR